MRSILILVRRIIQRPWDFQLAWSLYKLHRIMDKLDAEMRRMGMM